MEVLETILLDGDGFGRGLFFGSPVKLDGVDDSGHDRFRCNCHIDDDLFPIARSVVAHY